MSVEQHEFMSKNKILKYVCDYCSRAPKYCNIQEQLRDGFAAIVTKVEKDMQKTFDKNKKELEEMLENRLKIFEEKINEFSIHEPLTNATDVEQIKSDLKSCFNVVKVVDDAANKRLAHLEMQNNIQQRRLNRSNIIILGLPKKIKDLRKHVLKIGSLCNVRVLNADIQHCTYFSGGKKVLVKFNSVQTRDAIMINYHKNRALKLKDVIGGSSQSDIFLNDHLTDSAKKLIAVCRKLKEKQKITRYTFKNYDVPKVIIIMPDNSEKMFTIEQCFDLLDGDVGLNNSSSSTVNNSSFGGVFDV